MRCILFKGHEINVKLYLTSDQNVPRDNYHQSLRLKNEVDLIFTIVHFGADFSINSSKHPRAMDR